MSGGTRGVGGIGLIVSAHGRHAMVEVQSRERLRCHSRGKKSDCVVGDRVRWAATGDEGVVEAIEPRRNLLFRQDAFRTKAFAANLDQILFVAAAEPVFSESQLSRALISAEHAGITARILLNKSDLPSIEAARVRLAPYSAMGYDVIEVAFKALPAQSVDRLAPLMDGKMSLVLGPSGSGKSTLVNLLVPDARAQVGEISMALQAGKHTTTSTQLYWLDDAHASALIDTPGFQEFGLRQITRLQLASLMPDLALHADQCRFYNCTHLHEPACGVQAALAAGAISPSRMRVYAEIRDELAD